MGHANRPITAWKEKEGEDHPSETVKLPFGVNRSGPIAETCLYCSSQLFPPIIPPWGASLCQHESEARGPYIHTPLTCLAVESSESKRGLGKWTCITQAGGFHVVAGGWYGRGRERRGTPDVVPSIEDPRMRGNLSLSLTPNWVEKSD